MVTMMTMMMIERRSTIGDRAFPVAAARALNVSPAVTRAAANSLLQFRQATKAQSTPSDSDSPARWTGYCFRAISLFLCQQHYEKTAGPWPQIQIFREGLELWSNHGTT